MIEDRSIQSEPILHLQELIMKERDPWSALQGAERHAKFLAVPLDAEYRDCSCRSAGREAQSRAYKINPVGRRRALMPNPSLKRSANGMSRWPSSAGPAAHFALAVQRAMPLAPA